MKTTLSLVFLMVMCAFPEKAQSKPTKPSKPAPLVSCPAGVSVRWVCLNPETKQPAASGTCAAMCGAGAGGRLGNEYTCSWVRVLNARNDEQDDGAIVATPKDRTKPIAVDCMP